VIGGDYPKKIIQHCRTRGDRVLRYLVSDEFVRGIRPGKFTKNREQIHRLIFKYNAQNGNNPGEKEIGQKKEAVIIGTSNGRRGVNLLSARSTGSEQEQSLAARH